MENMKVMDIMGELISVRLGDNILRALGVNATLKDVINNYEKLVNKDSFKGKRTNRELTNLYNYLLKF